MKRLKKLAVFKILFWLGLSAQPVYAARVMGIPATGGGGSTSPGGSPNDVQVNVAGAFAGDANFQFDTVNHFLGIGPLAHTPTQSITISTDATHTGMLAANLFVGEPKNGFDCGAGCDQDGIIMMGSPLTAGIGNNYFAYIANGGAHILNAAAGSNLQLRAGASDVSAYFDNGGVGNLTINGTGTLVANSVLSLVGGNAAQEWDHNGATEFFVKNTDTGSNAEALIPVENNNGAAGQGECWLTLGGGGASALTPPLGANVGGIYCHNGVKNRISTQDANPIDFWTNAAQRVIISSSGAVGIGTATPASSAILDVSTTTLGSRPAPPMTTTQKNAIASPVDGLLVYDTTQELFNYWNATTSAWVSLSTTSGGGSAPAVTTVQVFTSGTAATYTTPTSPSVPRQLRIHFVGGGGAGGANTGSTSGSDSIFNSIHAKGGTVGNFQSTPTGSSTICSGGAGGSAGTGTATIRNNGMSGNDGFVQGDISATIVSQLEGNGATSAWGSPGAGGAGTTNSGCGGGGGAGEDVWLFINNPVATYTYTVGAGGTSTLATAGTAGKIIVYEYY